MLAPSETVRIPAPNVQTGDSPVAVHDPGNRLSYSVVDPGRSFAVQSHAAHQPGVQFPSDDNVRTNEGFVNIQPANTGTLFSGLCCSSVDYLYFDYY